MADPTAATVPDKSEPSVRGRGCGNALLPALIQPSQGPTPAALTSTRTSSGSGSGLGTLSKIIASGGPNLCTRHANMEQRAGPWDALSTGVFVILESLQSLLRGEQLPACAIRRVQTHL